MSIVIKMYRKSQYNSWICAKLNGGIYSTIIHSADNPHSGTGPYIVEDVLEAIVNVVKMMDGNEEIEYKIEGDK